MPLPQSEVSGAVAQITFRDRDELTGQDSSETLWLLGANLVAPGDLVEFLGGLAEDVYTTADVPVVGPLPLHVIATTPHDLPHRDPLGSILSDGSANGREVYRRCKVQPKTPYARLAWAYYPELKSEDEIEKYLPRPVRTLIRNRIAYELTIGPPGRNPLADFRLYQRDGKIVDAFTMDQRTATDVAAVLRGNELAHYLSGF